MTVHLYTETLAHTHTHTHTQLLPLLDTHARSFFCSFPYVSPDSPTLGLFNSFCCPSLFVSASFPPRHRTCSISHVSLTANCLSHTFSLSLPYFSLSYTLSHSVFLYFALSLPSSHTQRLVELSREREETEPDSGTSSPGVSATSPPQGLALQLADSRAKLRRLKQQL